MLDRLLMARRRSEEGASAVEYGLLVALIAAVVVVAVFALGSLVKNTFKNTCNAVANQGTAQASSACTS